MTWDPHQHFIGHLQLSHLAILCIFPPARLHDTLKVFSGPPRIILWMDKPHHTKGILAFFPGNCCLFLRAQRWATRQLSTHINQRNQTFKGILNSQRFVNINKILPSFVLYFCVGLPFLGFVNLPRWNLESHKSRKIKVCGGSLLRDVTNFWFAYELFQVCQALSRQRINFVRMSMKRQRVKLKSTLTKKTAFHQMKITRAKRDQKHSTF